MGNTPNASGPRHIIIPGSFYRSKRLLEGAKCSKEDSFGTGGVGGGASANGGGGGGGQISKFFKFPFNRTKCDSFSKSKNKDAAANEATTTTTNPSMDFSFRGPRCGTEPSLTFSNGYFYAKLCTVVAVNPGTGAHKAGLRKGDCILEINGKSTIGLDMCQVGALFKEGLGKSTTDLLIISPYSKEVEPLCCRLNGGLGQEEKEMENGEKRKEENAEGQKKKKEMMVD